MSKLLCTQTSFKFNLKGQRHKTDRNADFQIKSDQTNCKRVLVGVFK